MTDTNKRDIVIGRLTTADIPEVVIAFHDLIKDAYDRCIHLSDFAPQAPTGGSKPPLPESS